MTLQEMKDNLKEQVTSLWCERKECGDYPVMEQLRILRVGGAELTTMDSDLTTSHASRDEIKTDIDSLTDQSIINDLDQTDTHENLLTFVLSKCSNCTDADQKEILLAAIVTVKANQV